MFQKYSTVLMIPFVSLFAILNGQHQDYSSGDLKACTNSEDESVLKQTFGFSGKWQLAWDDRIDNQLASEPKKTCMLELKTVGEKLTGHFVGKVLGKERKAVFTGEVFGGFPPLVSLVQRESGYACTYQIFWSPSDSAVPIGVWHDTRGASGEFLLLKLQ